MRRLLILVATVSLATPACAFSDSASNDDEVATRVQAAIAATRTTESSFETAVAKAIEATVTAVVSSTPAPTQTPTQTPTVAPSPTPSSTPTEVPPTMTPTESPTLEPPATATANPYVVAGYVPFNRPEIDMMIHPRLSLDDAEGVAEDGYTQYRFVDANAEYLVLDVRVFKDLGGGRITHDFAQSVLTTIVDNTDGIENLSFVATDDTSMRDHHGVIVRHAFTIDGHQGYGVFMLISFDAWIYAFDFYGADYEYETIEELLHALFETTYVRGPNEQV